MNEMDLLTTMRDEVPLAQPSPAAERLFRAGLTETDRSERVRPTRPRPRFLLGMIDARGQFRWRRLAVPGVLAVGLTAALVALSLPRGGGTPAGQVTEDPSAGSTTMSAQLLADIAGNAVLSRQQPVKPDQWVYQKIEVSTAMPPGAPSYAKLPGKPVSIQTQWVMADGAETEWGPVNGEMLGGLVLTGPNKKVDDQDERLLASAAAAYSKLGSLPKNPAALEAYFADSSPYQSPTPIGRTKQGNIVPTSSAAPEANLAHAFRAEQAYVKIQNMLSSEILPPSLTAELYHALADVPGIIAEKNVKDISGQTGVEFILPQSPYNENLGTILSATTYQYLGLANWPSPPYVWKKMGSGWSGPGLFNEQVTLAQALVSGPGKLP
jgi:hypothetical protein